jgi:hypothetical protein
MLDTSRQPIRLFAWNRRTQTITIAIPNYLIAIFVLSAVTYIAGLGLEGITDILRFITRAIEWFHGG